MKAKFLLCGLLACSLVVSAFAQPVPNDKIIDVPNPGMTFPELLSRITVAFTKDVKHTFDTSLFKRRYTEASFKGTFEQILDRLIAESEIKLRWRKDGDKYVVEYSEPLVPPMDSHNMKLRAVLKTIFDTWGKSFKFDTEGDPEAPWFNSSWTSCSVLLKNVLSACRPPLDDEVDANGVHVITQRNDIGTPVLISKSSHVRQISRCEYNEDGTRAATMDLDGYVNVWDTIQGTNASPTQPGILAEHGLMTRYNHVIFASGSAVYLSTIGQNDRTPVLQNVARITAVSFADRANLLAVGDARGRVRIWRLDEAAKKATPADELVGGAGGYIHFLTMSEDGKNLAYVSGQENQADHSVIWVHSEGRKFDRPRAMSGRRIAQLGFNSTGDRLACCSDDGLLTYWRPGDFEGAFVKARLTNEEATVRFAFTPDGNNLVYSFENQGLRTENVRTGQGMAFSARATITPGKAKGSQRAKEVYDWNVTAMAYAPHGNAVLLGTDAPDENDVFGYNPVTKKVTQRFERDRSTVKSLQFSRDGKLLLVQDGFGLHVWRTSMEALPESIHAGTLALQPRPDPGDKVLLAVGSDPSDGSLKYWVPSAGNKIEVTTGHAIGNLERVVWSGDGRYFLTHDYHGEVALWPVAIPTDKVLRPSWIVPGNYPRLGGLSINTDGSRVSVVQSGEQGFFRIYQSGNPKPILEVKNNPKTKDHPELGGPLEGAVDGDTVAYQDGNAVVVVRATDGFELRRFDGKNPSLSAAGRFIAVQQDDGVRVYDLQGGQIYEQRGASFPKLSIDGTRLFGFNRDRSLAIVKNFVDGSENTVGPFPSAITGMDVMPGTGILAVGRADGFVSILSPKEDPLALFKAVGQNDYISISGKYYMGSPDAARTLTIGGSSGQQSTWDQWDLLLNRPDMVMRKIGLASKDSLELAQKAYEKRLKQLKFDPDVIKKLATDPDKLHLPTVKITEAAITDDSAQLTVEVNDRAAPIVSIFVTINGVPVQELPGDGSQRLVRKLAPIALCAVGGMSHNTIRISAVNALGVEGRATRIVAVSEKKDQRPDLYVIAVGVSKYEDPALEPLHFADADAKAIGEVFKVLAKPRTAPKVSYTVVRRRKRVKSVTQAVVGPGTFANVYSQTILNGEATRERLLQIRDYLASHTKIGDMVVLFFSGHGDAPDATYYFVTPDATKKNLAQRGFSFADIDGLFKGVPARQRLVLLDTCHSGESERDQPRTVLALEPPKYGATARGKDFTAMSNEFELMQQLFSNLEVGSGASIISASTGGGYATEDPRINHGAFTLAVIEGLQKLAARDEKSRVTVSSLKEYVLNRVQSLTGGLQKPTMRRQNAEFDFVLIDSN